LIPSQGPYFRRSAPQARNWSHPLLQSDRRPDRRRKRNLTTRSPSTGSQQWITRWGAKSQAFLIQVVVQYYISEFHPLTN
jgi:hypothetical protein